MVTFSCKSCHTHNCISSVKRGAGYTAVIPKRYQVKGLDHVVWPVSWQSEDAPKPRTLTQVQYSFYITLLPADLLSSNTYKAFHPPSPMTAYWVFTVQLEEEKLKFYITSCSFCLCNSACSLQSLDHVVSESGDLQY